MSELEDKLNTILSSPEAMGQIMALANSLGGVIGGNAPDKSAQPEHQNPQPSQESQTPSTPHAPSPDLSAMLSALSGGNTNSSSSNEGNPLASLSGLDPDMISNLMLLMQEYSRNDSQKTALLLALKPFLREERWAKVDRAVQIARLSRVIRMALQMLKGGASDV
jgi:hypothetical protein